MEKNQSGSEGRNEQQQKEDLSASAPGQVSPAKHDANESNRTNVSNAKEKHSESSLPQSENETIGTP